MAPEQRGEFLGGQRPAEIVALPLRAALLLEECALLSSFDPFRHHAHTQTGPHADHGADEADIVRTIAHEGVIDLQSADRKALQTSQACVTGTEVIERELYAHAFE